MRILIVDSNRVYAKKIQSILQEHVRGCEVDLAPDVWVMKRRLSTYHYDLLLVDPSTQLAQDELEAELSSCGVSSIRWSFVGSGSRKPFHAQDVFEALPESLFKRPVHA
jgi:hypothetical protein